MKEIIYHVVASTPGRVISIAVDEVLTKDNILGIINKTTGKVLYTPLKYPLLTFGLSAGTLTLTLDSSIPSISVGDHLLIKVYTDLDNIGDCIIYDYADSGLPAETGDGFCAYYDDGDFCIQDMNCHGEHAAQYKVGDIIHPTSDGDQTIDLVVAKSISSTPTDIRLDEYIMYGVTDVIFWKKGGYYRVTGIYDVYDSNGDEKLETKLITYENLEPDTVTGLLMQAIERINQGNQGDPALRQFFGLPGALPEYTALTPAEAIAIARDCQYNVMGTDWPIPTWLPTGVTEAQVESAAEGLGIPYHEPTQTA